MLDIKRAHSSGEKSSSDTVKTGECLLCHVAVNTDGNNAGSIVIYDNTDASGKVVWRQKVNGDENIGGRNWQYPIKCFLGIYAEITGTNAKYIVEWA
jgi:hypothetical protein